MKKFLILLLVIFATKAYAYESYYCDAMSGVNTPLKEPNLWNKIYLWFHNGVETTKSVSDFKIVIDGKNSFLQNADEEEKTPLILFNETEEKVELLEIGSIASSIYSIDKINKKVLQAKNGILPTGFYPLFKIELPYQIIMSSKCR